MPTEPVATLDQCTQEARKALGYYSIFPMAISTGMRIKRIKRIDRIDRIDRIGRIESAKALALQGRRPNTSTRHRPHHPRKSLKRA